MNTVTLNLEEYLMLKELRDKVRDESCTVSFYYSGHARIPEFYEFYTESEAIKKLIGDNAVLSHCNQQLQKEISDITSKNKK